MLTEAETHTLIEFINKSFGLDLSENLKPIALSELNKFKNLNEISDLGDFLDKFGYDLHDIKILDLLEIFLIPHTKFFRNSRQFEVLKSKVIPECIARKEHKNGIDLRIWSAGCSTGEEAYSILVSLLEYFGDEYWKITCGIMATDVSRKSLKIATKGSYEALKIDKIIRQRLLEYTEQEKDGKLRFKENLRKEANFKELNLNSRTFPFKNKFHIIFCRNILIYLNKNVRLAAENKILRSLENDGFIFLGDAEVLNSKDYNLEQLGNGIYRKRI